MTAETTTHRDSVRVFALVLGLLLGALVMVVAAPKRQPVETRIENTGGAPAVVEPAPAGDAVDPLEPGARP